LVSRLDQLVPNLGYKMTNVIPCCASCNMQRRTTSLLDMLALKRERDPT
jgi:hypothetical protein